MRGKIAATLVTVALLLCTVCSAGCAPHTGDWFSAFSEGFSADMTGELYGMPFSALLEAGAPDAQGVREATLTFYAPEALAGMTVRHRGGETVELSVGEVCIEREAAGYAALFALFPASGTVGEVRLEGEESVVVCEGVTLRFGADGAPVGAENTAAQVRVLQFVKK